MATEAVTQAETTQTQTVSEGTDKPAIFMETEIQEDPGALQKAREALVSGYEKLKRGQASEDKSALNDSEDRGTQTQGDKKAVKTDDKKVQTEVSKEKEDASASSQETDTDKGRANKAIRESKRQIKELQAKIAELTQGGKEPQLVPPPAEPKYKAEQLSDWRRQWQAEKYRALGAQDTEALAKAEQMIDLIAAEEGNVKQYQSDVAAWKQKNSAAIESLAKQRLTFAELVEKELGSDFMDEESPVHQKVAELAQDPKFAPIVQDIVNKPYADYLFGLLAKGQLSVSRVDALAKELEQAKAQLLDKQKNAAPLESTRAESVGGADSSEKNQTPLAWLRGQLRERGIPVSR